VKGIVLAGGSGSRLVPMTQVLSKQLLPIYDKPMIYYPLSVLLLADLTDILIISTPRDLPVFQALLGDGSRLGIRLSYVAQNQPEGLAQAYLLAKDFLAGEASMMVLGDNLFFGNGLTPLLHHATALADQGKATVFLTQVSDPERFGVAELDAEGHLIALEEKPVHPKSNYCVTGLYVLDGRASDFARTLHPSHRNELEITDLLDLYLQRGDLERIVLGRGFTWMDTGTPERLLDAAVFVQSVQKRHATVIAALEEIAFRQGWINREMLQSAAQAAINTPYGQHLLRVASDPLLSHE
jgi:glucose-1-phosphate thymidylyltransferase